MEMKIRKATRKDEYLVKELIQHGQDRMRNMGNYSQWNNLERVWELAMMDLDKGECYLLEANREVLATFCLPIGKDPTYTYVEGGQWSYEGEYGTLHRIASKSEVKGIGRFIMDWAKSNCNALRIDTHEDNLPMIAVIEANEFRYVGTIYVEDGTPRRAYEWYRGMNKQDGVSQEL